MSIVIISEVVTSKVIITIVVVLKSDVCLNYHFLNNAQIVTLELASQLAYLSLANISSLVYYNTLGYWAHS